MTILMGLHVCLAFGAQDWWAEFRHRGIRPHHLRPSVQEGQHQYFFGYMVAKQRYLVVPKVPSVKRNVPLGALPNALDGQTTCLFERQEGLPRLKARESYNFGSIDLRVPMANNCSYFVWYSPLSGPRRQG